MTHGVPSKSSETLIHSKNFRAAREVSLPRHISIAIASHRSDIEFLSCV
jgi:hypothetical protein